MSRRAVAPVVGVVLMLAVMVALAGVVGVGGQTEDVPTATITAESKDDRNEIFLTHRSGNTLDVTQLTVRIFVDGKPLEHQPDVPFFSETGFVHGTTGPFHPDNDHQWTAGETARFEIASTTNSPQPKAGSRVTVKIYTNGTVVATARV
ncbi:type IV pilin [Halococcus agarilyticus]|uniref:type IV pilin n=1 Tax=Halococcus agarilyticus TaxID=1232219 RepID=UPI0009ADEA27|nr:type IV pilin N-terminal domain-containing protein [Halococcus agarilyticus]